MNEGDGRSISRRDTLRAAGTLTVGALVGGELVSMTPAGAARAGAKLRTLSEAEGAALGALADAVVPGAREAGIVPYLDHQLGLAPRDCLLVARYLDIQAPFIDFYRQSLGALEAYVRALTARPLAELIPAQRLQIALQLSEHQPAGWQGPPAPLFLFALRGDAVDVTYGTVEGFERLGVPYLAHILPERPW